ncbi:hypothetical protein [Mucilaginibacter sp.]|uniref:hypothetical protein n=1 Tax=Mucilaginibacter sp. TaxID=1882438 RepID=UPI003D111961
MDAETNQELQKERIGRFMIDHVDSIWKAAVDDEEERKLVIQKFPDYFENGIFEKGHKKVNIITMYRDIEIKGMKDEVLNGLRLYNLFSKVEHNGILSFNLLHSHYESKGAESSKYKVYLSLKNIMMVTTLLIRHAWNISDDDKRFKEMVRLNNLLVL